MSPCQHGASGGALAMTSPLRAGGGSTHLVALPSPTRGRPEMEMSEDDINMEEYPTEIHDYLAAFEKSLGSVDEMLKTMMSVSRSELLQKGKKKPAHEATLLSSEDF